jgi:hypothetical protein
MINHRKNGNNRNILYKMEKERDLKLIGKMKSFWSITLLFIRNYSIYQQKV